MIENNIFPSNNNGIPPKANSVASRTVYGAKKRDLDD